MIKFYVRIASHITRIASHITRITRQFLKRISHKISKIKIFLIENL